MNRHFKFLKFKINAVIVRDYGFFMLKNVNMKK